MQCAPCLTTTSWDSPRLASRPACATWPQQLGPRNLRGNTVSAGPIKTLAAKGIRDFNKLLDYAAQNAPLRRNVTIEEVGNTAAFLCSDLASGITGEVWYVDAGHHITAMPVPG